MRIDLPLQRSVAIVGPKAIYDVLVGQAQCFEKSPMLRTALYPLAGNGLFTSEGPLWKRQRKLMSPIFRFKELHSYANAMARCAENGMAEWRDGETLDIARETTRIAMSVAGKTLFDADTFSEADELGSAMSSALDWVNESTQTPLLMLQSRVKTALMVGSETAPQPIANLCGRLKDALHAPIIPPGKRRDTITAALDVLEGRVERMIAERRNATTPGEDLLTQLLGACDEAGSGMSDKQVRDEILTLFIAGHETTASGLAWSLYLLARHPEAYERAQQEADALTEEHVRFEDVKALPFCSRVFKEALRMYPPIYIFGRQAVKPVTVAGYKLPRGTIAFLCPFTTHYRQDLWEEPHRFNPDRFTPEAEQNRPREAFLPFSGGPRTCIGNHFALMEAPIVLATLLRRARFELASSQQVEPHASATLRPLGGVPMRIHLRQPAKKARGDGESHQRITARGAVANGNDISDERQ